MICRYHHPRIGIPRSGEARSWDLKSVAIGRWRGMVATYKLTRSGNYTVHWDLSVASKGGYIRATKNCIGGAQARGPGMRHHQNRELIS